MTTTQVTTTMKRFYDGGIDHYDFVASKNGSSKTHLVFLTSEKRAIAQCGVGIRPFDWKTLYETKQTINGVPMHPEDALMSSFGCKNCQKYYKRFKNVITLG